MIEEKDIREVGRLQRTHGLKGELNALLDIDPSFFDEEGNPMILNIDGAFVPFYVSSMRSKGAVSYLVSLEGVVTQQEAQALVNHGIYAEAGALMDFMGDEDLMNPDDLTGFLVVDAVHGELGTVRGIDDTTANVLFIIDAPDGSELLIPMVDEFITAVDEERRIIDVRLPEALIQLNKKKEDE